MAAFYFPCFFYICSLGFFRKEVHIPYELMDIHFVLWIITRHNCYLLLKLFQPWVSGALSEESWFLFIGEWHLETKIWALGVLIAAGVSLLLSPSADGPWKCVYSNPCL